MQPSFAHKAVYGMTTCGKTTLVKKRIENYLRYKQQVIVYPGNGDLSFPQGVKYAFSPEELEEALSNPEYEGAFIVVDESDTLFSEVTYKRFPKIHNLTVSGRHDGHTAWLITQFPKNMPKRHRRNCGERYMFLMADHEDAIELWQDCSKVRYEGKPLADWLMTIPKYSYFHFMRDTLELKYYPAQKMR